MLRRTSTAQSADLKEAEDVRRINVELQSLTH